MLVNTLCDKTSSMPSRREPKLTRNEGGASRGPESRREAGKRKPAEAKRLREEMQGRQTTDVEEVWRREENLRGGTR